MTDQTTTPDPDLCLDRGPRVGEDGTACYRPKGHEGSHRAHESWGTNPPEWSQLPKVVREVPASLPIADEHASLKDMLGWDVHAAIGNLLLADADLFTDARSWTTGAANRILDAIQPTIDRYLAAMIRDATAARREVPASEALHSLSDRLLDLRDSLRPDYSAKLSGRRLGIEQAAGEARRMADEMDSRARPVAPLPDPVNALRSLVEALRDPFVSAVTASGEVGRAWRDAVRALEHEDVPPAAAGVSEGGKR